MESGALKSSLAGVTVSAVMTSPVKTAYEGWSVRMLIDFFMRNHISGAPVAASDGELVGVVSVSDVLRFENLDIEEKRKLLPLPAYQDYVGIGYQISEQDMEHLVRNASSNCTVNQIMTPSVINVDADAPLLEAVRIMHAEKIHRIFAVRSGKLAGVVSTSAVLEALLQ
jgi:predicted transcriptional regulator